MLIDTLMLALGVDPSGMDKGLSEAQRKMQTASKSLATNLLSPMKAAFGALAAGLSLGAVTNQYLSQADAIGKMADSIGADIEELQAWSEAAARAGGSAQGFQQSLQSMNRILQAAANGQGVAAKNFQQFGIKVTDATGKARDSFDVLRDLAGAMESMDKQKAVGFAQRLGLDRGTIMLLQSGRAAVDDLIERQKQLGVYTKEDAEIAAKANDAIADLGQSLKAAAAIVMRAIVPAITWVAEKLTALMQDFREHKALYLSGLGAIAAFLTAKLMPNLIKLAALNASVWAPYTALAGIIAGVALVFEDLWVYMHGGESALEDYWKTLGTGPELLEKFSAAWNTVKERASSILTGLKNLAGEVFAHFAKHIDNFIGILDGIFMILDGIVNFDFKKVGQGLGQAFSNAATIIANVFTDIGNWIIGISWDSVKDGAKKAWDTVKDFALGFFKGLPKDAQEQLSIIWTALEEDFAKAGRFFAKIFDFVPDFSKIVQAIKNAFKEAWNWVLENIPGAKWLVGAGQAAAGAVADVVGNIGNPDDYENSIDDYALASLPSSTAAGAGGGSVYNDAKTVNINVNGAGNPEAVGRATAAAIESGPAGSLARQAMNGNRF